jgi:hypothetical protein
MQDLELLILGLLPLEGFSAHFELTDLNLRK